MKYYKIIICNFPRASESWSRASEIESHLPTGQVTAKVNVVPCDLIGISFSNIFQNVVCHN